ncbi:MAG: hypothetical protein WB697_24635 [Stellaceae bacterium]
MQNKNVPAITPPYWVAILVASICGTNTGDFLSHNLHLGHWRGLLPLAAALVIILWAKRRARIATEAYYWLAIIVLRTAATNLADLSTHALGSLATEIGLTLLLIIIVAADRGRETEAPLPSARPTVPTTTVLYWLAMLIAGTLGTASGDFTADVAGLGLFYGSAVLVVLFGVVLAIAWPFGGMSKPWYWATIVGACTAGTTLGDMLASRHGLDLGLWVSTTLTAATLATLVLLWPHRRAADAAEVC